MGNQLALEILGRSRCSLLSRNDLVTLFLPHARGTHGAEGEEHTQGDAQAPDGLHLEACGLGGAGPHVVVDAGHVGADGVEEGARGGVG